MPRVPLAASAARPPRNGQNRSPATAFVRFAVRLCAALALLTLGIALGVDRFGQREHLRGNSPVIIVLGARVLEGGSPSPTLQARVEKAVQLYRAGNASILLFSGGVGDHAPAEAIAAKALALRLGVPAEACRVEDASHSTLENARNSARILRQMGIQEGILVSDPYHLYRARQYFRRFDIKTHPSPALLAERNQRWVERVWWTLREAVALEAHPSLFLE